MPPSPAPPPPQDLVEAALVLVRQRAKDRLAEHSARRAEAIILRALVGQHAKEDVMETFRDMYRRGERRWGGGAGPVGRCGSAVRLGHVCVYYPSG